MRIYSHDSRYMLDRAAYHAFLVAQGLRRQAMSDLVISLHPSGDELNLDGTCGAAHITIYTWGAPAPIVNLTLLHETRHYWQLCQAEEAARQEQEDLQHLYDAQELSVRDDRHRRLRWLMDRLLSREETIPYEQRPTERDARAFAARHAFTHQFITRSADAASACLCHDRARQPRISTPDDLRGVLAFWGSSSRQDDDDEIVAVPLGNPYTHEHTGFCLDPTCPCHEDEELIGDVNELYQGGLLTGDEASRRTQGKTL